MREQHLQLADQALAEGNYVVAVEHLEKVVPMHPELGRLIQEALERMKKIGTREMAAGRWTVAEGILDVVKEHQQHMSDRERAEVEILMDEIHRLRDVERNDALVRTATSLAAHGRHAEARHLALSALRTCEDLHLAARMRCLLRGLPHPDGRLLFGFDSALEIRQFCRAEGGADIELFPDLFSDREGSAARIRLPGTGALVRLLDVPQDWSDYAEINFWIKPHLRPHSGYAILIGDGRVWFRYAGDAGSARWNQVHVPLDRFAQESGADWKNVTRVVLAPRIDGTAEFLLDEIRLKPR